VRGGEQLHSGHIWHALVGQDQRDLSPAPAGALGCSSASLDDESDRTR
jgi:hypothetical protein